MFNFNSVKIFSQISLFAPVYSSPSFPLISFLLPVNILNISSKRRAKAKQRQTPSFNCSSPLRLCLEYLFHVEGTFVKNI